MNPLRSRTVRNLLFGLLLPALYACGNEPVKHTEEMRDRRIPHMTQEQIEDSKKPQKKTVAKKGPPGGNKQPPFDWSKETGTGKPQTSGKKSKGVAD